MSHDAKLIEFHKGSVPLFEELVRAHSPRMHAHAMALLRHKQDAQDLVQDTWLHAFRKRQQLRDFAAFVPWIYSVLRSQCLGKLRREGRHKRSWWRLSAGEEISIEQDPDVDHSLNPRIAKAIRSLSEFQYQVLVLRIMEGLSTAETAAVLRRAEGTVRAGLYQARTKLRRQLGARHAYLP